MSDETTSQIMLNFLDRVLDENMKCAEALVGLRFLINEQRQQIDKIAADLHGPVKAELKSVVMAEAGKTREAFKKIADRLDQIDKERLLDNQRLKNVDEIIEDFKKKSGALKYIAVILTSIATIVGGTVAIMKLWKPGTTQTQSSVQPISK